MEVVEGCIIMIVLTCIYVLNVKKCIAITVENVKNMKINFYSFVVCTFGGAGLFDNITMAFRIKIGIRITKNFTKLKTPA